MGELMLALGVAVALAAGTAWLLRALFTGVAG